MTSTNDSDLIQIAIQICCHEDFKKDVFFVKGKGNVKGAKRDWDELVEKKAMDSFQTYHFEFELQQKLVGYVMCISIRMLTWIEYYAGTFDLSVDFCVDFLTSQFFTPEGLIDEEKVANVLLDDDTRLRYVQKYKLACHYCRRNKLGTLFRLLTISEKESLYNYKDPRCIHQEKLVKFWTYYMLGELDFLRGNTPVDDYRFRCAIESGSIVGVKYCLEKSNLSKKRNVFSNKTIGLIKLRHHRETNKRDPKTANDWIVFDEFSYNCSRRWWIPNHFFVDTLFYLLSKMSDEQKKEMLKNLFTAVKADNNHCKRPEDAKFLEYFLAWPYQNQFMELIKLAMPTLVPRMYGSFLVDICDKIDPRKGHLYYGESKCYDYRHMFEKLWELGPEPFKRYIFSDKFLTFYESDKDGARTKVGVVINEGKEMLIRFYEYMTIIPEQQRLIRIFLNDATEAERVELIVSDPGAELCNMLLNSGNYKEFDVLLSICFSSQDHRNNFKRRFCLTATRDLCLKSFEEGEGSEANAFLLGWCPMTEEEALTMKEDILMSDEGKYLCRFLSVTNQNSADLLVQWGLYTATPQNFKFALLNEAKGMAYCQELMLQNSYALVDKHIRWCLEYADDVKVFKEGKLAVSLGLYICEAIITGQVRPSTNSGTGETKNRWLQVDDFLSWLFTAKLEIPHYKRHLLEKSGADIIFKFIDEFEWTYIEEFFSWLCISGAEVRQLKKKAIYPDSRFSEHLHDLLETDDCDETICKAGGKQKILNYYLKWILIDDELIKDFGARNYRLLLTDNVLKTAYQKLEDFSSD